MAAAMKLRPRFSVFAVFVLVLLIGVAFIKQGLQQRDAQRRLAAIESVDRVAAALEREGARILAMLASGEAPEAPVEMVVRVADGRIVNRSPVRELPVDAEDIVRAAGPVRGQTGEPRIVVRLARTGEPGQFAAAIVDLNGLLARSGVAQLPKAGFDYFLSSTGGRKTSLLSRSIDTELQHPLLRDIVVGGERWSLALAPRDSREQWPTALLHGLITLVLAFAVALAVRERSHEDELLRDTLKLRGERLHEATAKLAEEVEQRSALEKQFSNASFHDALTGLPNRRFLVNRLEASLRRSRTVAAADLAIAIFGLERIKVVSDSLGLAVADELVAQVARRLEASLDHADQAVARLHDVQFACVLSGMGTRDAAMETVRRLHASLAEPFVVAGHTLYVAARAGIAFTDSAYDHPEDLIRNAHIALSQAKGSHSRVVVFDPGTQEQVVSRHQLETDLHGVAERGELRLNFQPIVALDGGDIVGFEALVRWQHPLEGLISPGVFIPLAEETGLITPITRWVLREACRQARAWHEELGAERRFYVSVNLSGNDMRQHDLGDFVEEVMRERALPRGMLRLEVTESSMIDNIREAVELITRLRQLGAQILLDDFGTGYSSLSYLHRFPIDYLKIDQSFVRRMTPDPKSSGIVRAILYLAQAMEIETVAEGIETADAMRQLIELGCDYGQGYHFSKPVDAEAARRLLATRPVWQVSSVRMRA
jgi:diguanylate cyclase (GGDEF)-like protein